MIIFDNSICKVNPFFPSRHETSDSKIGNNWQAETLEKDAELKNHGGLKKEKRKNKMTILTKPKHKYWMFPSKMNRNFSNCIAARINPLHIIKFHIQIGKWDTTKSYLKPLISNCLLKQPTKPQNWFHFLKWSQWITKSCSFFIVLISEQTDSYIYNDITIPKPILLPKIKINK